MIGSSQCCPGRGGWAAGLISSSVAMPAGSFVTHYGKQVDWDGAKDTDAVLLIVGGGPATTTPFVAAPTAR
jgi:hypothetical protein